MIEKEIKELIKLELLCLKDCDLTHKLEDNWIDSFCSVIINLMGINLYEHCYDDVCEIFEEFDDSDIVYNKLLNLVT